MLVLDGIVSGVLISRWYYSFLEVYDLYMVKKWYLPDEYVCRSVDGDSFL
jgi:hypothetical protein